MLSFPTEKGDFCPLKNLQAAFGDLQAFSQTFNSDVPPGLNLMGPKVHF
jgi:hypothetical protein